MKSLIILFSAIMITTASAQYTFPKTVRITDRNGVPIATGTVNDNRMYIRNNDGSFLGTLVFHPDGSTSVLDEDGKVLKHTQPKKK